MRKIKIKNWKASVPVYEGEGKNRKVVDSREQEENILIALNLLIANKKPEELPKGLDKFRLFNRLTKAFTKAEKTKILKLEEVDYSFLKDMIEKDVPSVWGMNDNLFKALEAFLEAKPIGDKEEEKND